MAREVSVQGLTTVSRLMRDVPEVRRLFAEDPMTFLEKYVQLDLDELGISRADVPSTAELRRMVDDQLAAGGNVSIAVCAVVV